MELFENLPSTNTPILAVSLNQIQDNLVVVSPTEPTGNDREKVWIQKGKNLFNEKKSKKGNYSDTGTFSYDQYITTYGPFYISGTIYISGVLHGSPTTRISEFKADGTFIKRTLNPTFNSAFTLDSNTAFICVSNDNSGTNYFTDFMVSPVKKEYEPYIEPKIYVKNDNGVYEEFVNAEDIPSLKKISVSEFFDSTSYTISDFEAYQYGKIINIQRMIVQNVGDLSGEANVGVINSKYLPSGNNTMRTLASSGGNAIDYICFINSKNTDGNTIRLYKATETSAASVNAYLFNISYLID